METEKEIRINKRIKESQFAIHKTTFRRAKETTNFLVKNNSHSPNVIFDMKNNKLDWCFTNFKIKTIVNTLKTPKKFWEPLNL